MQAGLAYLLFFASGFSALIYEVAWARELGLVLGNTAQATSCILSVFLGGLAIGAYAGGKLAHRIGKHLLAYGAIELSVGVLAPAVTRTLHALPAVFAAWTAALPAGSGWLTVARLAAGSALLLLPTVLMGATLPLLTRYLCCRQPRAPHFFSMLYGINTLGASAGALAACFFGFACLGVTGTVWLAAVVNLAVAAIAVGVSSRGAPPLEPAAGERLDEGAALPVSGRALPVLYLFAALTGFTALGYEVLWTRLLRLYTSSSTYAFTFMVSTFLLGLALGSLLYNRTFANKSIDVQWRSLASVQYASALTAALGFLLLPAVRDLKDALALVSGAFFLERTSTLLVQGAVVSLFMLVPSLVTGISFPMIAGIAARMMSQVGKAVGTVYAVNTLGSIAGSLVCGLILVPAVGSQFAYEILVGLSVATGVLVALVGRRDLPSAGWKALVAVCACTAFIMLTPAAYLERDVANRAGGNMLAFAEDSTGSVIVMGYDLRNYAYPPVRKLLVNGEPYSSTIMHGLRYMRLLGHLPVLLHRAPSDVLSVCFGTGTTAGASALHREVKQVDIVELSPSVLKLAGLFRATNEAVLSNPRASASVDDGRNYLLRSLKKYDVVTFEPPPPYEAGVVNLYTREFYELVRKRLKPGGIVCQWAPMALETESLWKMLVKAAADVFPHVSVWVPNNREALLVASVEPHDVDLTNWQRRIESSHAVKSNLAEVGLGDPYALLSTYLISDDALRAYLGAIAPVTDERPQLEFFLPFSDNLVYPSDLQDSGPGPIAVVCENSIRNLDRARLDANVRAIRLLRLATKALAHEGDAEKARLYIEEAAALLPGNRFFEYARQYPRSQL
ncbi:MAG TPA: fused MFS/spermidine synthase [Candidatus Obscuribacterales bacterium]